jgi:ABC-type dipeptide/oligopeptide/nickel transport system permease subunit
VLAPGGTIVIVVAAFTFLGHGLDSAQAKRT